MSSLFPPANVSTPFYFVACLTLSGLSYLVARHYFKSPRRVQPNTWPEQPFKLIHSTGIDERPEIPRDHYAIRNVQLMALTHNTIFRGLNALYHQALQVRPGTAEAIDFLFYCKVLHDFLHIHHETEEAHYFPQIEKAAGIQGLMQANVQQHEAFHEEVERFHNYATKTPAIKFDGEKVRRIIDAMVEPLGRHLHEEIHSLLELWDKVESKALKEAYRVMHDAAERMSPPFEIGPYVLGCQDSGFLLDGENIRFPEAPLIAHYVVDYVLARKHAGVWRFSPSTMYGEPRRSAFQEKL